MKRVIALIMMAVFVTVSFSGCKVINSLTDYWDGMTKRETREYVQDTLEEKYGEEFVVENMYITGASWDSPSDLLAKCYPKSDESIIFDIEANAFGKGEKHNRYMYDNYIQNVIRKQLKQIIDDVLAENYENFVSQVFVTPLKYWYESGIHSANSATIENFSESFTDDDDNYTLIYIVIEEGERDFEKIKKSIQKMCNGFHSLNINISCYYANKQTVEHCKETIDKSYREIGIADILRSGDFEMTEFGFFNDDRGLVYFPKNN